MAPRPARPARTPVATYVALAALDTWLAAAPSASRRRLRIATKPLLMPALTTAFARATAGSGGGAGEPPASLRPGLRAVTMSAQALSGVGDVALLARRDSAFLAGMGAFFGAHVAYTLGFASQGRPLRDPTKRTAALATALLGTASALGVGQLAGRRSQAMRGPVSAYGAMISTMVASSLRLDESVPSSARRQIELGTGLFLASDCIIAARSFVVRDPRPWSDAVVMATYTAGQGLIALGLAQAARAPHPAVAAPPVRVEETGG